MLICKPLFHSAVVSAVPPVYTTTWSIGAVKLSPGHTYRIRDITLAVEFMSKNGVQVDSGSLTVYALNCPLLGALPVLFNTAMAPALMMSVTGVGSVVLNAANAPTLRLADSLIRFSSMDNVLTQQGAGIDAMRYILENPGVTQIFRVQARHEIKSGIDVTFQANNGDGLVLVTDYSSASFRLVSDIAVGESAHLNGYLTMTLDEVAA